MGKMEFKARIVSRNPFDQKKTAAFVGTGTSAAAALKSMATKFSFEWPAAQRGVYFFGFPCTQLQAMLYTRTQRTRKEMLRQSFTATVTNLKQTALLSATGISRVTTQITTHKTHHGAATISHIKPHAGEVADVKPAALFGQRSRQKAVTAVKNVLADNLLIGRNPEARLMQLWAQLLNEPEFRELNLHFQEGQAGAWVNDPKMLAVVVGAINNIKEALGTHKGVHSEESRKLYQTLLNILAPKAGEGMFRATAKFWGLQSRRGLVAAAARNAGMLANINNLGVGRGTLFVPGKRSTRQDKNEEGRRLSLRKWKTGTRVTSNSKNVRVRAALLIFIMSHTSPHSRTPHDRSRMAS
jgi:hypothetical protein